MQKQFSFSSAVIGLAFGILIAGIYFLFGASDSSTKVASASTSEPLYWVAPMDPNYRRDKPGKSPMGMDLIPVYAEANDAGDAGPGTISISPEVINNLGVRTAKVTRAKLKPKMTTVGYIQYDEDQLIHIHPRVQGWIEKLFIKAEGDPVKKGEPLYQIYSPELVNAQEEFLLALERKNERLIRAARERLTALQLPQRSIQALIETRKVSQTITFYAPQSGVVDNLKVRQGFFVQPGTTLMSIGALDHVWVEAEVFERQLPFVELNMPVTMTLDYLPGKVWKGKVDYIYPTLNAKTRTAKLRLKFDNRDRQLKPNMYAQVEIHADSLEERLVVPREAVIRTGNQNRLVLALNGGRFKSVEVILGLQDDKSIEVLEGISEQDNIVVSAQFLIDSESSKTSDFKRMLVKQDKPEAVWTAARINSVIHESRTVNATHSAIAEWDWPEMTMDFLLEKSVDLQQLKAGMNLHIEITRDLNKDYIISDIHIMDEASVESEEEVPWAEVDGVINSIDRNSRLLNISRGPIAKWSRQAATMDFILADNIDINQLTAGKQIKFRFEVKDDLIIVELLAMKTDDEDYQQNQNQNQNQNQQHH
ncbi:efflux RND transporter periplasmic adaptor subunit [Aliikangiella sp. IMCC44653]